jgi:hypothetical protein
VKLSFKLVAACFFFLFCNSLAYSQTVTELQIKAEQKSLWSDASWLNLLHYREKGRIFKSEADDEKFFLSEAGFEDPKSELLATIPSMFAAIELDEEESDKNHTLCRFPARSYWLAEQLAIDRNSLPKVACNEFNKWVKQFNAHSITLVFPSAYINSPSSMFGHTFIRVDPENLNEKNRLLSISINYAADMDPNEGQISMIFKGLFGGFKGQTSVLPYHIKVKQYSDLESRDIWEYHLDFTKAETEQFVRHIWEIGFVNFNYFYIDENCAYRILAFLEAVRPMGTLDQFSFQAIPANTIQALERANAVADYTFRPSISTQLSHNIESLNEEQQEWLGRLIREKSALNEFEKTEMPLQEKSAVLETSYEALRYKNTSKKSDKKANSEISFPLLLARSKIQEKANLKPIQEPKIHSAAGHRSSKVELGGGVLHSVADDEAYASVQIRPSYHQLTDPLSGYSKGAQIEFLNTEFRTFEETSVLEHFKLVNIYSLSPKEIYTSPKSWLASAGMKRLYTGEGDFSAAYIQAGMGKTYRFSKALFFALATAEVQADKKIAKGFGVGPGIETGWLYYSTQGQSLITLDWDKFYTEENYQQGRLKAEQVWNMSRNQAVVLSASRNKFEDYYYSDAQVTYRYFF